MALLRAGRFGYGTVFKLSRAGKGTILHSFAGGSDGIGPVSGLTRDAAGNLYGTTEAGGGKGCIRQSGCGTVFKLSRTSEETVLYRFDGAAEGETPAGGVIRDAQGNLYGTTEIGGDLRCYAPYGCGTVFMLSPAGVETILYNFSEEQGFEPSAGVISDGRGNLYGTTVSGGSFGTVFKLTKTRQETTLYQFTGGSDGAFPFAGLVQDKQGNSYGTTAGWERSTDRCSR